MAEEKTYNIVIKNETQGNGTPVATKEGKETKAGKPIKEKQSNSVESSIITFQTIRPYVSQLAGATVSNIGMYSGAMELQQRAQMFSGLAGTSVAIGTAIATGNYIGVALMGVTETINLAIKSSQMAMQKKLEQEQVNLRSSRLGMATDRSRWQ